MELQQNLLDAVVARPRTPSIDHARTVEYFGMVNYATNERVISEIRELVLAAPKKAITLQVTSAGGSTGRPP